MTTKFITQNKEYKLFRHPYHSKQNLQAWDAADEYLLEYVYVEHHSLIDGNILIFNDSFGAITLGLNQYNPDIMTDSIISKKATHINCAHNNIDTEQINIFNSLEKLESNYNLVLIKLPKTLDFLRYFLAKIGPHINNQTKIIVAGMIKSMPKSVWDILEDTLGETSTSLAKKKARLIFVKPKKFISDNPFPTHFKQQSTGYKIYNHANVFSKQSMDIGTRFLLQNLSQFNDIETIIDLGCGNGVVGLNLAKIYPAAKVIFTDESYMAVASAKLTATFNLKSIDQHQFIVNNCLDDFTSNSVDLIVCNPPFHQSHSIGLHIALQMFQQSFKTLKSGGHFIVVANRHLPYYSHLKRIFGTVNNLSSNNKFNLYSMKK